MQRYKDFRPTPFDSRGLACEDQQDWFVAPVSYTRDDAEHSLAKVNFDTLVKDADEKDLDYEIHRFGHWGPGWFEIMLVHPKHEAWVEGWEGALNNYPIASDDLHSARENEAVYDYWACLSVTERRALCREVDSDEISGHRDHIPDGVYQLISDRIAC